MSRLISGQLCLFAPLAIQFAGDLHVTAQSSSPLASGGLLFNLPDMGEGQGVEAYAGWLARIGRGDRSAFAALYASSQPDMLRYASRLLQGDAAAAADAVDEAFLDIWRSASHFTGQGNARGWIRRIVHNKSIDWMRKRREIPSAFVASPAFADTHADTADTPEVASMKASRIEEVRGAMEQLKPEFREVILLCYFEEKSLSDIAALTGVPEGTVKTRLFHARKALKALLPARPPGEGSWP